MRDSTACVRVARALSCSSATVNLPFWPGCIEAREARGTCSEEPLVFRCRAGLILGDVVLTPHARAAMTADGGGEAVLGAMTPDGGGEAVLGALTGGPGESARRSPAEAAALICGINPVGAI